MTRNTEFSLPGMREEARTTVSLGPTLIGWSRLAMRDSTAIGSPCDPVQMSTVSSSGRLGRSSEATSMPPGMRR